MSAERIDERLTPEELRLWADAAYDTGRIEWTGQRRVKEFAAQWDQERLDAEALRERNEALERERDILKAYSNWASEG